MSSTVLEPGSLGRGGIITRRVPNSYEKNIKSTLFKNTNEPHSTCTVFKKKRNESNPNNNKLKQQHKLIQKQ